MKIDKRILERFNELILKGGKVLSSGRRYDIDFIHRGFKETVDSDQAGEWATSSLNLLNRVLGKESDHYISLNELYPNIHLLETSKKVQGILKAAKDDYENGYLFNTRALIEAEVFDDFLEQSEHLLNQGYFTAAAVVAGSVLEDGLRKLCVKNGIALSAKPKLDVMNADLAKVGVYNLLKQKQITALADLRNKAAHGQGGFTKEDVESMIKDVRRFMEDYFS